MSALQAGVLTINNCCCDRENNSPINIYLELFDKFFPGLCGGCSENLPT